jgi:hypothetical protein
MMAYSDESDNEAYERRDRSSTKTGEFFDEGVSDHRKRTHYNRRSRDDQLSRAMNDQKNHHGDDIKEQRSRGTDN